MQDLHEDHLTEEVDFVPKPGQTDYTHIKYVPVVSCVLFCDGKILLIQRTQSMRFYPGYWGGVSGFLDDDRGVVEKAKYETREEVGIDDSGIVRITEGSIVEHQEPAYKKVWEIHPVKVEVKNQTVKLDWEGQDSAWVTPAEAMDYNLLPGFDKVIKSFFPSVQI